MDILKTLQEKSTFLEDRKSVIFFKVFDVVNDLEGLALFKNSMFLSIDELETKLSKLGDKWDEEFYSLSDFSRDNMRTWTIDYLNLNHNISVSILEAHDDLLEIERDVFQMKIKKEIIVPSMRDFIHNLVEKQLAVVVETTQP